MKKFILCADGFGKSKDYNRAVLNGYSSGFVKSASIVANGNGFEAAINEILPECQKLSVGVHLTLPENILFNLSKSLKNLDTLKEIEDIFRRQIETVQKQVKIYHINSEHNIHYLPELFAIVCKLADEYEIPYVRSHNEELYYVPDFKHILSFRYMANIANLLKLNSLNNRNMTRLKSFGLKTANYTIGTGYSKMMDAKAIEYGLKTLSDEDNIIVEGVIRPCSYLRNTNDYHSLEFKMTQDKVLEDTVCRLGYEIVGHKNI